MNHDQAPARALFALADIAGRDDNDTTSMIFSALERLSPRDLRRLVVEIRLDVMDADDKEDAAACVDSAIISAVAERR